MNFEKRCNAVSVSSVLLCTYYQFVYRITYTYTAHEIPERDQSVKYGRGQSAECLKSLYFLILFSSIGGFCVGATGCHFIVHRNLYASV